MKWCTLNWDKKDYLCIGLICMVQYTMRMVTMEKNII